MLVATARVMVTVVQINIDGPSPSDVLGSSGMDDLCAAVNRTFLCDASWRTGAVGEPLLPVTDVMVDFKQAARNLLIQGDALDFMLSDVSEIHKNDGKVISNVRKTQFRNPGDLVVQSSGYMTQLNAPPYSLPLLSQWADNCHRVCQNANAYRYATKGKGVTVYVVDQDVMGTHQEFGSASGTQRVSLTNRYYSPTAEQYKGQPCASWHGTHVAALVAGLTYGVAKDVWVVPVAVQPGCDAGGYSSDLAAGLDWVLEHHSNNPGPAIVTMSLLISDPSAASVIQLQVQELLDSGVIVIAAAGNYAEDACTYAPANLAGVIAVSATQLNNITGTEVLEPWPSTNYGSCVSLWAPGYEIESASSNDTTSSLTLSGTSQAAPMVAGLVAQYLQRKPDANHSDVLKHLHDTATVNAMSILVEGTIDKFAQVDLRTFVHGLPLVQRPGAALPAPPPPMPPMYPGYGPGHVQPPLYGNCAPCVHF